MKYMILMMAPQSGWNAFGQMSPAEIGAHIGFMKDLNEELKAAGELVDAQGLDLPHNAKIVRADERGKAVVTDGPFPESKEFLAGFWIVDLESKERAIELAARISAAPGKGGKPMNFPVELRRVPQGPGEEM